MFCQICFRLFIILSCLLPLSVVSQSQKSIPIVLQDEKPAFTAKEFYITGVMDDRADKQTQLYGGTAKAINQFIDYNLPQDHNLHPVVISVKQLKIAESVVAGNRVNGQISLSCAFGLQREFDTVYLVNYTGGLTYSRPVAQTSVIEANLRRELISALSWFNTWMNKQADHNPVLAKSVRLTFSDFTERPEGDTIYYSANRPITWDDFKAKPGRDRFDAEVFASVGYDENVEVENGIIYINLAMKTYFPKSAAWVKYNGKSDYALNHEQRHFDIAKIIAERFKRKIAAELLPVSNYDGPINVEYLETLREAYKMQTQYDKETAHGNNSAKQEEWNRRIDKELSEFDIVKALN